MGKPPRSFGRSCRVALVVALAFVAATSLLPPPASASYPPVPLGYDATFLSNLTAPDLAPGNTGSLTFYVGDPATFASMSAISLELDVYAFNAFPGNAGSTLASAGAPVLVTPTTSGTIVNLSLPPLSPNAREFGFVGVATSSNTPSGAFAVRTALSFVANGTNFRLESRGWFSASVWAAATELPNGSATLNLTTLGVSGVTAETAILVSSSSWTWALTLILGASIVLVAAGAFVYFRRGPKSSSGAR